MNKRLAAWLLFSFFALLLSGCSDEPETPEYKSRWSDYVSAQTGPVVSKASSVRVVFAHDAIPEDKVGTPAGDVFEVDPSIEGSATYSNRREIVLVPKNRLTPGQRYDVTVSTKGLAGFPDTHDEYQFSFEVKKQEFAVSVDGLGISPDNQAEYILTGNLVTADADEADQIEKILQAQYLGQNLAIAWNHDIDGFNHRFTVSGITKQDKENSVELSWNGEPIGVENEGSREIEVPAKDVFKVIALQAMRADSQFIKVDFSAPLRSGQNLNGLVRVDQEGFSLKTEGNSIKIYPAKSWQGTVKVTLERGIKGTNGLELAEREEREVAFASEKPQVRFVGKGVILPENDKLTIPFEAVNVRSVQVTAFRIYPSNMGQFLQTNKLDGEEELSRVGRYLWRKRVPLSMLEGDKWNRYSLDASELLRSNPGGMFRLTLSIDKADSIYACGDSDADVQPVDAPLENYEDLSVREASSWDYAEDYEGEGEGEGGESGSWEDRADPCKHAYYRYGESVSAARNFLASNLGIIAKRSGRGPIHIVATDLRNAVPVADAAVRVMNFQDQEMGQGKTDGDGLSTIPLDGTPFYVVVEKDGQTGYLKINAPVALPVSHFDVGGERVEGGVKGHIYGERGVWRPGDPIYLTFVLQDKENAIPPNHPVTMQLVDPQGQMVETLTNNAPVGDFYTFQFQTGDDATTGNWTAKALLGGSVFTKTLKIETVMPNRLKVELDFGAESLRETEQGLTGRLFSQWLHGAKASNLDADVAVTLSPRPTAFERFTDHVFDDPAREFSGERQVLFEGALDSEGRAEFDGRLSVDYDNVPGMLTANFQSRVFEQGGAFSSSWQSFPFHAFDNYVGIKLPKGDEARGMLLTDVDHTVSVATLDADGKPVSLERVEVSLYKIEWKWWWDQSGESLANFASGDHAARLQNSVISSSNGQGKWTFQVKYPDWGRYLVRACDLDGGHCTGKIVYIDWPGWAGRAQEGGGEGASVLTFTTDKQEYQVGEEAVIQLPEATQGRALVSIENGSGVIEQRWVKLEKGESKFTLPITAAMSPNVYASVTLVQPHKSKDNDRPIRLYGVTAIKVNDAATRLEPSLSMADELKPRSKVQVKVAEKNDRAMTYTLALVDEGLLGLTNFKTPKLHGHFYKKEALGVTTWDMFDYVVGAYGGELERILALGGSDEAEGEDSKLDEKRFPPVVRFLGPFKLKAGDTNEHEFELPQYIGAVRVMLVAGQDGAYGSTDKSVVVREPLAMLSTLPRVLSPEEQLRVPVSLFVADAAIKDVTLKIDADDHFEVIGDRSTKVSFDTPGEKIGFLGLKVKPKLGKGRIKFIAEGAGNRTESEVFIDILSPNTRSTRLQTSVLKPGEEWNEKVEPFGLEGTNRVVLEMSAIPPINLESRLSYLIQYPHGCIEQTTSSVFPQLSLPTLAKLSKEERASVDKNIAAGIARLRGFQTSKGGFAYWPGNSEVNAWGTNYAGHFLISAEKKGYFVPPEMLAAWVNYQQATARSFATGTGQSQLDQAYRLYTLALAGKPEFGAMNRLRESAGLSPVARWQLAAAYQIGGLSEGAQELARNGVFDVESYAVAGNTFGSELRDKAIMLTALVTMKQMTEAKKIADEIAAELSKDQWHSTQSVAYALLAMASFVGDDPLGTPFTFSYRSGATESVTVKHDAPVFRSELLGFPTAGAAVAVKNTSDRTLYGTVIVEGVPRAGNENDSASGLVLRVNYGSMQGGAVDVARSKQGSDIVARISVTNTSGRDLDNVALSHLVPSGWEIHNPRLAEGSETAGPEIDYQDIRDDRIYTYFPLKAGQTKEFKALFNAAYLGRFYLPGISVEAMYDATKQARVKGQWVEVVKTLDE